MAKKSFNKVNKCLGLYFFFSSKSHYSTSLPWENSIPFSCTLSLLTIYEHVPWTRREESCKEEEGSFRNVFASISSQIRGNRNVVGRIIIVTKKANWRILNQISYRRNSITRSNLSASFMNWLNLLMRRVSSAIYQGPIIICIFRTFISLFRFLNIQPKHSMKCWP